ncbi:MAG: SDR family oxidoreductase [Chloroflexota bacterium]
MKAILVTGASTGIGEACVLRLADMGFRVFAGVRRLDDGMKFETLPSRHITPVRIDVTDTESIKAAAAIVQNEVGENGLVGLVNNAGIAVAGPLEYLPVEELRAQFEVNVMGQVAVTQAFLPLIRKGHGRIVNIGSISGRIAIPLMGPYCASKFALEAITSALRMELQPWGIHVAIIEPSAIATPIWKKALGAAEAIATSYPSEALERYGPVVAAQRKRTAEADRKGLPRGRVVRDVVHALTSPRPKTRYVIGLTSQVGEIARILPDRLRERLILRQVAR